MSPRVAAPDLQPLARPFASRTPARHVRGQAIAELLAAAGLLVALFVGVVLVGRLHDLQWSLVQSSRYAAFEAVRGHGSPDSVTSSVRARFYGAPGVVPLARDRAHSAERWTDTNPHWVDHSRRSNPLVARPADVTVVTTNAAPSGTAGRALATLAGVFDRAASLGGGRFDVERRGVHAAVVRVRVAPPMPIAPFDRLHLELTERATLFGGDWSASGPAQTASRTGALVPTAPLAAVRPVVHGLRGALAVLEPSIRELCLGRVDPEIVPLDRLSPYPEGPRGGWVAPC